MSGDMIVPEYYGLKGPRSDIRRGYFDFFDAITGLSLI